MVSQEHHAVGNLRTVGDHHSTITKSTEIL